MYLGKIVELSDADGVQQSTTSYTKALLSAIPIRIRNMQKTIIVYYWKEMFQVQLIHLPVADLEHTVNMQWIFVVKKSL